MVKLRGRRSERAPVLSVISIIEKFGGQTEMSDALGIHKSRVSMWKYGDRKIPVQYCFKIRKLLNGAITLSEIRPDLVFEEFI